MGTLHEDLHTFLCIEVNLKLSAGIPEQTQSRG
jgi:hypothetical protein